MSKSKGDKPKVGTPGKAAGKHDSLPNGGRPIKVVMRDKDGKKL